MRLYLINAFIFKQVNKTADIAHQEVASSGSVFGKFIDQCVDNSVKGFGMEGTVYPKIYIFLGCIKRNFLIFSEKHVKQGTSSVRASVFVIENILFQGLFDIVFLKHEQNQFKISIHDFFMMDISVAQAAFSHVIGLNFIFDAYFYFSRENHSQFIEIMSM